MTDHLFMVRALELAELPERSPSPNPRVGAVVVRDGTVVGEGWHVGPGEPHAEEVALSAAGELARGATLFCTLEPCSHSGCGKHRPACAPLVAGAGIARVVIAQLDPNPRVRGNGVAILRAAGLQVDIGTGLDDAMRLTAGFSTYMTLGRPLVHLKCAQSLDGRIAAADGSSRWLSGDRARELAHQERGGADAVVVGIGTVLRDDPLLTVRFGPPRNPRAVVMDREARMPLTARLIRERANEVTVVVGPGASETRVAALRAAGAAVVVTRARLASGVDLAEALTRLGELGLRSLYVEGGSRLLASFLRARAWDRMTVVVAPVLLGGPWRGIDAPEAPSMRHALWLERVTNGHIDKDVFVHGYRPGWWGAMLATCRPGDAAEAGARAAGEPAEGAAVPAVGPAITPEDVHVHRAR